MKQIVSMLLLAAIFTACEKQNDLEVAKLSEPQEETYSVELQFPGWAPQGWNHKVNGLWVMSDLEMTLRYYGADQEPQKELSVETFTVSLDSIKYYDRTRCNPDVEPWQCATINLNKKQGWYMISTKFLFSTGSPEEYEYNDTLTRCHEKNGDNVSFIYFGQHDMCYSSDTDVYNYKN